MPFREAAQIRRAKDLVVAMGVFSGVNEILICAAAAPRAQMQVSPSER